MKKREALSDFDYMRLVRLPNWGFWGRHDPDKPNCQRVGHSICVAMLRRKGDPDVWDGAEDPPPDKVNNDDAEALDAFIRQLPGEHKENIRRVYYKQEDVRNVGWERLNGSIRALLDLSDSNRMAVAEMKRRLYGR